jgi:V8-like Glu-specific endopeptidase
MNRNLIRISLVIVGIILLTTIVLVLNDEHGAASQPSQEIIPTVEFEQKIISNQAIESLSESSTTIWTREMMLAAQPYPLEIIPEAPAVSLELSKPTGSPGMVPSSPPAGGSPASTESAETLTSSQAIVSGYNYPPPYARYQNFDSYQVFPYSTIGVMFFTQGGVLYRCSAASIGDNAIWTAGHCIHAGDGEFDDDDGTVEDYGTWSKDVIFVPAYHNGNTPFGVWEAEDFNLKTTSGWFDSQDLRFDMGGAVLNVNGGQELSQVVGSLGFKYNMNNSLHWLNVAYPSESPFSGSTQQICAGSFTYSDTSMPNPSPVAMGCDMTRGSSGGPWVLDFSGTAGNNNFLNGNNSYRYGSRPEELYSPYFGWEAKSLWNELSDTIN